MVKSILAAALAAAGANCAIGGGRTLDADDFCYYRCTGRGETFAIRIARVTTNEVARQAFWRQVAADKVPVIHQLTFTRKKGWKWALPERAEDALEAIDAFFAPGEGIRPCPEKIFAVTPAEENITWAGQLAVQDAIARHMKAKYGVKTYQWLSEPLKPTLAIQADGWVFDAYCVVDPLEFRSHLESFVLTGLPVVPCLWGSGKWGGYHKARSWDELTRFTLERMDLCRSFGMPVMMFSVAGKMGSAGLWFGKAEDPGDAAYREAIKGYMASVPERGRKKLPNVLKKWRVAIDETGKAEGRVDLTSFGLVRETMFENVHYWRLTPEGLSLVGADSALAWWMFSSGVIRRGRYTLRHSPGAKGTFGGRPLSPDGVTVVEADTFGEKKLVLRATAPLVLKSLEFSGQGEYKVVDVELEMDTSYGRTDYRKVIAFAGDEARLSAKKGVVATRRVMRKVALPGCGGRIMVEASVRALKSHAGTVSVSLSLDGATPVATATTAPGDAKQTLSVEHLLATPAEEVYLVVDLKVASGIESHAVAALAESCDFKFRPLHP